MIFSHRFLNTSLPLITVLISIPTPPWKQGLNTHNPLPSLNTIPCNSPSTSKRICHFSSLLKAFFSGPGYKCQKASKAASVCKTPSISTVQYCVNKMNLNTEENGAFSIKPLMSKNADTALQKGKRCLQVLIKPETKRSICILMQIYTRHIAHLLKWVSFSHSLQN